MTSEVMPSGRRTRTGAALLLLALAAIALQRSATVPWASVAQGEGVRILVSPIGLVQQTAGTAETECRWWPQLGNETLCAPAPGGEQAMTRLRRAYPLVVVALWTSVLALFLNLLRVPRRLPWLGPVVAVAASALPAVAIWGVAGAGRALGVLSSQAPRFDQPGFLGVAGAALVAVVAAALLSIHGRSSREPDETA